MVVNRILPSVWRSANSMPLAITRAPSRAVAETLPKVLRGTAERREEEGTGEGDRLRIPRPLEEDEDALPAPDGGSGALCDDEANAAVPVPLSFLLSDILPKNELLSPRADPPRGARVRAGRRATVPDPEGGAGPVGEGARPVVGRERRRAALAASGGARHRRLGRRPEKCLELSKTRRIWSFSGRA